MIKISVQVDSALLEAQITSLINDEVMTEIHNVFAKMCDPYVPMQEGVLSQSINVTPQYVEYRTPYAHYQYMGLVYGPNIPIYKDGQIVGWFSPPGQKKYPTGASIQYSKEQHPLATHHWDQAMMTDKGEAFIKQVQQILERRARELYG